MEENKNPLSPHLQIYKWQISSLLSITHRIVGVINILLISSFCFWVLALLQGENFYKFLDSEEFILKLSEVLLKNHIDLKLRYYLKNLCNLILKL